MDKALPDTVTVAEFADAAGISVGYACEILNGRAPSVRRAIDIYRRTGRRFGSAIGMSDATMETLEAELTLQVRRTSDNQSAAA